MTKAKPMFILPLDFFRHKIRIRLLDQETGQPLSGIPVTLTTELGDGDLSLRFVVGTLMSDHVGYLSFSLKRYNQLTPPLSLNGEGAPAAHLVTALLVDAPAIGVKDYDLASSLLRGDVSRVTTWDTPINYPALLAKLGGRLGPMTHGIEPPTGTLFFDTAFVVQGKRQGAEEDCACHARVKGMRSIEDEDDWDRMISPGSFFVQEAILVGEGDCQVPTPAKTPAKDIRLYQVVINGSSQLVEPAEFDLTLTPGANPLPAVRTKRAKVARYLQRWTPLGYSLGDIKYSLPLAPGESVNLAVIEWSREDRITRRDTGYTSESLDHRQRRDRDIEETVMASVSEDQGGGNFMAGLSASALIPVEGVPISLGTAIGGGVTHTWGQRDISGETAQNLRDRLSQKSEMIRSLDSTTIIQVDQREKNDLSSRTVANHNRCHALTIQYYEVLRNYRVDLFQLPDLNAVLIPFTPIKFDVASALKWEYLLKPALLNPELAAGFEALRVREYGATLLDSPATTPQTSSPPSTTQQNYFAGTTPLTINPRPNNVDSNYNHTGFIIEAGSVIEVTEDADSGKIKYSGADWLNVGVGADGEGPVPTNERSDWEVPDAGRHQLVARIGSKTYPVGAVGRLIASESGQLEFLVNDKRTEYYDNEGLDKGSGTVKGLKFTVKVTRPTQQSPNTTLPSGTSPQSQDAQTRKALNTYLATALIGHLDANAAYYNRVAWLGMDRSELEMILGAALGPLAGSFDAINPTPVAIWRNYLAFIYEYPDVESPATDRLLTSQIIALPTRGVLAEAQLGNCVSCEERDATRVQEWTLRPDDRAPRLDQLVPGPKGQQANFPQQVQFGSPGITIQPIPNEPDPTGLKTALDVLAKGDLFRNMSAQAEVAGVLQKLAEGSFKSLDEAQKAAKDAKEKSDRAQAGNASEPPSASAPSGIPATEFAERLSLLPELKNMFGLDPELGRQITSGLFGALPAGNSSAPTRTPIPQAKPDEIQIFMRVRDAWDRPADSDIFCTFTDDAVGPQNVLSTGIRTQANYSSSDTSGTLPPLKGLTKGVLDLQIQMLSSSYENMASEVVDLEKGGIPYEFPKGTRFATFYARQEYDEVKVTVNAGETLASKVGSAISGTVTGEAKIKIVEASLQVQGTRNWEDEYNKQQSQTKEFTLRVPNSRLAASQTSPKVP